MRLGLHWLPLLAAVLLATWLLWPSPAGEAPRLAAGEGPVDAPPAALLEAEGAHADSSPVGGPSLSTHGPREPAVSGDLHDCTVLVLAFGKHKRVGAPVRIRDPRRSREALVRLTDRDGAVRLQGVPLDGSVVVEALQGWTPPARERVLGRVALTETKHEIACEGGLPYHVELLDAESGKPVSAAWTPLPRPEEPALFVPGPEARIRALPGSTVEAGLSLADAVLPAHVAWDDATWKTRIARYATRVVARYPLRRHARVHVRAEEHDGTLSDRAQVEACRVAGRHVGSGLSAVPDRGGFLLRGVPFLRERPIEVLVTRPPEGPSVVEEVLDEILETEEDVEFEMLEDESAYGVVWDPSWIVHRQGAAVGRERLPRTWETLCVVTARFPRDPQESVPWGRGGGSFSFRSTCGRPRARAARGGVEARVLRRDGSPAGGALVWCDGFSARADAAGLVRFESVEIGARSLRVSEPGFVLARVTVEVREGALARVDVREPAGATLRVCVVDARGDGLPFATVRLPDDSMWVDLAGGVQRIDPFTDARGRRTLARVPAGTWALSARWADLRGKAEVEVRAGATHDVVVTLKE